MTLKGKTALVTGASGTIGRAIALSLADEDANIVVNYRTREKEAAEVASQIERKGSRALMVGADISVYSEAEAMVKKSLQEFGSVDILVNNALVYRAGKVHKLPLEDWDVVIKSVLYGTFHCCRCVLPFMLEKRWGRIINISSPVGERGYPGDTAYGASKAGLLGFTKSLAKEVASYGITVNVVIPGFVPHEGSETLSNKSLEQMKRGILLGRPCKPEEVADMVTFLASKGDYITGSIHHVDGGLSI